MFVKLQWGSNRTYNIDGAEVSNNAILVTRMHLATIALLCKQTSNNFRSRPPPERPIAPSIEGGPQIWISNNILSI